MKGRRIVFACVAAVLVAAGCSSDGSDNSLASSDTIAEATTTTTAEESDTATTGIYGVWLAPDGDADMSFNEDDSYAINHGEGTEPAEWGTFTFDGERLTLSTDPDSTNCREIVGTYDAAFTAGGDLELTDVEDPCTARRVELSDPQPNTDLPHNTGTLVRISP